MGFNHKFLTRDKKRKHEGRDKIPVKKGKIDERQKIKNRSFFPYYILYLLSKYRKKIGESRPSSTWPSTAPNAKE